VARDASGGGGGVVGVGVGVVVIVGREPVAQGGAAQAGKGADLGLLHGLAREPEAVANLLQRAGGLPVETVAGGEDGALAGGSVARAARTAAASSCASASS